MTEPKPNLSILSKLLANDILGYEFYSFDDEQNNSDLRESIKERAWLSKRIFKSTNAFLSFVLVCSFLASSLFAAPNNWISYLLIGILSIFLCYVLLIIIFRLFVVPDIPTMLRGKSAFESALQKRLENLEKRRVLYSFTKISIYVKPFRFQYVWWWILIVGVVSANADYINKGHEYSFNPSDFNSKVFLDFAAAISKSLIISILAYIASNIIRELLTLRDKYDDTNKQVDKLSKTIVGNEDKIKGHYDQINEIFKNQELGRELGKLSEKIIDSNLDHSLQKSVSDFQNALVTQVESINKKLSSKNDLINFWIVSALGSYTSIETDKFNHKAKLVTNYKIFAKLLKTTLRRLLDSDTLKQSKFEFEIYSICILSPERYLNYKEVRESSDKCERYTDNDWDEYLQINREAAFASSPSIKQNRHFISIDATDEILTELSGEFDINELRNLKSSTVKAELNYKFLMSSQNGVYKTSLRKQYRYQCSKYLTDAEWETEKKELTSFSETRLGDLLNNVYHKRGLCQIIEVKIESKNTEILDGLILDKETKKPIDYYAIRDTKANGGSGEWLVSFKGPYDESFDVIELQILSKDDTNHSDAWKEEVKRLDSIFIKQSQGLTKYKIDEYK